MAEKLASTRELISWLEEALDENQTPLKSVAGLQKVAVEAAEHGAFSHVGDNVLSFLEENWERVEILFSSGTFELQSAILSILLACSQSLPGAELLSLAALRKATFPPPPKSKKPKKIKKVQLVSKPKLETSERYWTLAHAAIQSAKSLVSIITTSRSDLLCLRAAKTLSELCLPTTYFTDASLVDGQETDICTLTSAFNYAVNGLITVLLDTRYINFMCSPDLRRAELIDVNMHLIHLLSQNSNMNYAKLREALSKSKLVTTVILPRIKGIVQDWKKAQDGPRCEKFRTSLLGILRVATALSFRLKTARQNILNSDPTLVILSIEAASSSPQILATLCKLHVNIEGGFGEEWKKYHRKVGNTILEHVKWLRTNCGDGVYAVFIDCLSGSDGVPIDRSSRAFAMISDGTFKLEKGNFQNLFEEGTARRTYNPRGASGKSTSVEHIENSACRIDDVDEITTVSKEGKASGYAEWVEAGGAAMGKGKRMKNCRSILVGIKQDDLQTDIPAMSSNTRESRVTSTFQKIGFIDTQQKVEKEADQSAIKVDDMDDALFPLAAPSPPSRFCCGITGQVMHEPVRHPRGDIWVDRESLEIWSIQHREKNKNGVMIARWPGPEEEANSQFLPEDIGVLETDRDLQEEIQLWRMRKILKQSQDAQVMMGQYKK